MYIFPLKKYETLAQKQSTQNNTSKLFKTYDTEFDEVIITCKDQDGRPIEIEDKIKLTLPINK